MLENNPSKGLSKADQETGMLIAKEILQSISDEYGIAIMEYVSRVAFLSVYVTSLAYGFDGDTVLSEFDNRCLELRGRLIGIIELKPPPPMLDPSVN